MSARRRDSCSRRQVALPAVLPGLFLSLAALAAELPANLADTGLYVRGTLYVDPAHLSWTPQYPLWSDGATKRRWVSLPAGSAIDASDFDAWEFPPGTRFWKEFGHGHPVETRFIERLADGSWRYAVYVWNAEGTGATLARPAGIRRLPVAEAPGGYYTIPSQDDCRACHEGAAVPILGLSALQVSPARDALAPNAERRRLRDIDLSWLVRRQLLRNVPASMKSSVPYIRGHSAVERAALGYLHANCGHCHNERGPLADLGMTLSQTVLHRNSVERVLSSLIDLPAEDEVLGSAYRLRPGQASDSQLWLRMQSRNPTHQMPPLGSKTPDAEALRLVELWIQQLATREGKTS